MLYSCLGPEALGFSFNFWRLMVSEYLFLPSDTHTAAFLMTPRDVHFTSVLQRKTFVVVVEFLFVFSRQGLSM